MALNTMNHKVIISKIREDLTANADEKTKKSGERFFKEEVHLYGVKSAMVGNIAKENFKAIKDLPKAEIFELCEELWKSVLMEESFIACNWSYFIHKKFTPKDFCLLERWVGTYLNNWASCDTLCNHTVGSFLEMYPEFLPELKRWAKSPNRWMRRAAAVSLIVPARRGKFLTEIFELADIMLMDGDDMVQKGYGWMLKVASQSHLNEVFEYIMKNKTTMPRTALRYAIEKMPPELRAKAMAK
ncbi:MAG: DNA alkylation repair protein [Bacteroidetes bacterium GWF2_40_14]|nr:MAG: DNA alkylation repair protein [Bacteroidetes bacterium GWF2_40_14]